MKKFFCIFSALILSISILSACSNNSNETTSSQSDSSIKNSTTHSSDVESIVRESSSAESSDIISESSVPLPTGVTQEGKNKLKYTNSVLSLSVIFPDDFCITDNDYNPKYGVYLQNKSGNATLMIESVEDNSYSQNEFVDLLSEKYPDSEVYINDYRCVICKRTFKDSKGNQLTSFLKVKVKNGGYNKILLTCGTEEKSTFERIFNQINFS